MSEFTEAWAEEQKEKVRRGWKVPILRHRCDEVPDPGPESDLQRKAQEWMDNKGFPWIHDRSRGKNRPGQILDLYCFLPKGRVEIFEFKVKGNTLSDEQEKTYKNLIRNGHRVHECRSFKGFLGIVDHDL